MGAPAKPAHDVAETTNGLEGSIERHTAGRVIDQIKSCSQV
jgi:hypothetical protein